MRLPISDGDGFTHISEADVEVVINVYLSTTKMESPGLKSISDHVGVGCPLALNPEVRPTLNLPEVVLALTHTRPGIVVGSPVWLVWDVLFSENKKTPPVPSVPGY